MEQLDSLSFTPPPETQYSLQLHFQTMFIRDEEHLWKMCVILIWQNYSWGVNCLLARNHETH